MNLTTFLLTLLSLMALTSATPIPQTNDGEDGDTGANYVQCLNACNGDSTACLAVPKNDDYTVLGVTFMWFVISLFFSPLFLFPCVWVGVGADESVG